MAHMIQGLGNIRSLQVELFGLGIGIRVKDKDHG